MEWNGPPMAWRGGGLQFNPLLRTTYCYCIAARARVTFYLVNFYFIFVWPRGCVVAMLLRYFDVRDAALSCLFLYIVGLHRAQTRGNIKLQIVKMTPANNNNIYCLLHYIEHLNAGAIYHSMLECARH